MDGPLGKYSEPEVQLETPQSEIAIHLWTDGKVQRSEQREGFEKKKQLN